MKKLAIVVLCFLLLASPACVKTPEEAAAAAMRRTAQLKARDVYLDATFILTGAKTDKVTLSAHLQTDTENGLKMNADSTVERSEEKETASIYQAGEWFYVTVNHTSYKSNLPELIGRYDYASAVTSILQNPPEEAWQSVQYQNEQLTFALRAEALADYYGAVAEGAWRALATDEEYALKGTLKLEEWGKYVNACTLTLVLESENVTLECCFTLRLQAPGGDVSIVPPTGYQFFPEYNFS